MEPFKNKLSPALVDCIASHLAKHHKDFDVQGFRHNILSQLDQLELKQRSQLIADQLHHVLPADFNQRNAILRAMLHPLNTALTEQQSDKDGICGWGMMPLCTVVGQYGLADFDNSMQLLREMTSRFTAEFDVRFYLLADQQRALKIMESWLGDRDDNVRRLVSEGTRPRLPWGQQLPALIADPSPMIPLLTALRDDESEYVRRSVANHLNDIAKDHPDLVANLAADWLKNADKNRERLVRHACRTLIKQGHVGALRALGIAAPKIELEQLKIQTAGIRLGDPLPFSATLRSTSKTSQALVIDYVLHLMKANGSTAPKVFKWKKLQLAAGETLEINKSHPLRAITTRRYYSGQQQLSLRINGEDFGLESFALDVE